MTKEHSSNVGEKMTKEHSSNVGEKTTFYWVKYFMYMIAIAGFVISIVALVKANDNNNTNNTNLNVDTIQTKDLIASSIEANSIELEGKLSISGSISKLDNSRLSKVSVSPNPSPSPVYLNTIRFVDTIQSVEGILIGEYDTGYMLPLNIGEVGQVLQVMPEGTVEWVNIPETIGAKMTCCNAGMNDMNDMTCCCTGDNKCCNADNSEMNCCCMGENNCCSTENKCCDAERMLKETRKNK
jgi:hypothetical protein